MKKAIVISTILLSLLATPFAQASEELGTAVISGFESWHSNNRDDLNPHNTGIGIRLEGGWTLGTYYNSIRRWSTYAGREWQWKIFGTDEHALRIGAVAGAVTGYLGGVKALVLPELLVVWKPLEVGLIVIPRYTKDPITVALQARYNF
jgi:hypothetical protein